MTNALYDAVYAIPVPGNLCARVLTACRRQATAARPTPTVIRFVPAAATAAVCAAVLGVTLASTGQLPFAGGSVSTPLDDGEAPTTTEKMWEENYSHLTATELATEPGNSTTKNFTTTKNATTSLGAENPHGTVVGTTSAAQPPVGDSTTHNNTTQTTWKGTTTTKGNNAVCQLVIPGRFESMWADELEAHYGRRYLPTRLPADMVQLEIYVERGIYYKDEAIIAEMPDNWNFMLQQGTIRDAEIIYDENSYEWYSQENADRRLIVHVSTAPYPQNKLGDVTRFNEAVTVVGVEVKIHHYSDAPYSDTWCYSAVAQVDGVAFYVSAWEFTREEFLDTLASLLEG